MRHEAQAGSVTMLWRSLPTFISSDYRSRHFSARSRKSEAATGHRPPKNDGNRMSRIVRKPGAAVMTAGMELTTSDAVAMSP